MKFITSIIIGTLTFSSINVLCMPINKKRIDDNIIKRAQTLKECYQILKNNNDNVIYEQQFFNVFPDSFEELNMLYGYRNDKPSILSSEFFNQITLFNNLNDIEDTLYFRKLISISIGGHWDADAIELFQENLHKRVLSNINIIVKILDKMDKKEIISFWFFYFDGPHPTKHTVASLQKLKDMNRRVYNLMCEAQKKVLEQPNLH